MTKWKWIGGIAALLVVAGLSTAGYLWLRSSATKPREAPELEKVLAAQAEMPFQVLIPAYLPAAFDRKQVKINTQLSGPRGEPMIELVYSTRRGDTLALREWLPADQGTETQAGRRGCCCRGAALCNLLEVGVEVGSLRVTAVPSSAALLSLAQKRLIVDTLGPPTNRQIYTSASEVPITYSLPPAVDVPVNDTGIQELVLVVTPNGYVPAHFQVKKGVPVKLTFRQLGQVGCGNELIFSWETGQSVELKLASPGDAQVLEFVPRQTGDFPFNCPHLIYRGAMTVKD